MFDYRWQTQAIACSGFHFWWIALQPRDPSQQNQQTVYVRFQWVARLGRITQQRNEKSCFSVGCLVDASQSELGRVEHCKIEEWLRQCRKSVD